MPSLHETRMANAVTQQLRVHGQLVPFTPVGAGAAELTVEMIVSAESLELAELNDGRELKRQRVLQIHTTDVTAGTIGRGAKATIDGEIWTVHQVLGIESGLARVVALCPQRTDTGGRRMPR